MFVQDQCQDIHDRRLDQIERQDTAQYECELVGHDREDLMTHPDDGFQRHVEHLYVRRNDKQIVGSRRDDTHE